MYCSIIFNTQNINLKRIVEEKTCRVLDDKKGYQVIA